MEIQVIKDKICSLPGRPSFMLDYDLAEIYETETKRVNEAVKRNPGRFPDDFCFQLSDIDVDILRSQNAIAISNMSRSLPYAFTREGANMLSALLRSDVAVERSVQIMRAFSAIEQRGMTIEDILANPENALILLQRSIFEREQKQLAEKQRDEALRTKAWISDKKTATAMATASKAVKERERALEQVGNAKTWKQVKAIPWLRKYFDLNERGVYSRIGKMLSKLSKEMGYGRRIIDDSEWGSVNAYHINVINAMERRLCQRLI